MHMRNVSYAFLRNVLRVRIRSCYGHTYRTLVCSMKLKAGQVMGSWWRGCTKDGDRWRCFSRCRKFHISRKMLKIYAAGFAMIVSSLQVTCS